jgi:hypothetical protein
LCNQVVISISDFSANIEHPRSIFMEVQLNWMHLFENLKSSDTLEGRDPPSDQAVRDRVPNDHCGNLCQRDLVLF